MCDENVLKQTPEIEKTKDSETNLCPRVGQRSWAGQNRSDGRASGQTRALTHLTEDAAALIHNCAALTLPL